METETEKTNKEELIGALKRLIVAAQPYRVPTSVLNMRIKEAIFIIKSIEEN